MKPTLAIVPLALFVLVIPTSVSHVDVPLAAAVPPPLTMLRGVVERNATLARLLDGKLSAVQVQELVEAARPVHDLARLAIGRTFGLATTSAGAVATFTYCIDDLNTLRVFREGEALRAERWVRSYEQRLETATGTIQSSLFGAVMDSGEQDQLALDLAEIFAWDVDFNTEIQRGDTFRVAVEKRYLDGHFVKYGSIHAAEFLRGRRVLRAVQFDSATTSGYYAPDGQPLRKAFLRSPLKFSRITSGFTQKRFHPILGKFTSHLGIDFGAPIGTPVQASADGVVIRAGWSGGFGNTVELRHANGFQTLYGHLSRINVRAGERVSQGACVGLVGSTGLSTGPHLDYRMRRAGAFVNPLTVALPPAEPVPAAERAAFEAVAARALATLASTPTRTAAAAPAAR